MNDQDWHYLWIKTLVEGGMAVESAEHAFREQYGEGEIPLDHDPVLLGRVHLAQKAVIAE